MHACMCVSMYMCAYNVCVSVCTCIRVFVCVSKYMYVFMNVCQYVHVSA